MSFPPRKTSIIILSHNTYAYTRACIESVRRYTAPGSYELIAVDNGSTDGSVPYLLALPYVRCIENYENKGFPAGCNQGMAAAKGEDILLLNSDTIVTPNWLENLRKALYASPKTGAVGCVTNYAANDQQTDVPKHVIDSAESFVKRYMDKREIFSPEALESYSLTRNASNPGKWEPRPMLTGFCFLLRKEVYEKIGGFDEVYGMGNFEDNDYSLRILQAGWNLILCKDTFIVHFGSRSFFGVSSPEEVRKRQLSYLSLLERNRRIFEERWHLPEGYQGWPIEEVRRCLEQYEFVAKGEYE